MLPWFPAIICHTLYKDFVNGLCMEISVRPLHVKQFIEKLKILFSYIECSSNDVFHSVSMHHLKSISILKVTLYFDSLSLDYCSQGEFTQIWKLSHPLLTDFHWRKPISYSVFNRRKNFKQVWNNVSVSKLWPNFHLLYLRTLYFDSPPTDIPMSNFASTCQHKPNSLLIRQWELVDM